MFLSRNKCIIFLILWIVSYIMMYYVLCEKNILAIMVVFIIFASIMYFVDIRLKKWGLINKFQTTCVDPDVNQESVPISAIPALVGVSMALLTFTVGYIVTQHIKVDTIMIAVLALTLTSSVCFLFALEAQETCDAKKWGQMEKKRFGIFVRWLQIVGWHSLFLYLFLILSFVNPDFSFYAIILYTLVLCYYYFITD